jgi:hypothetical protein
MKYLNFSTGEPVYFVNFFGGYEFVLHGNERNRNKLMKYMANRWNMGRKQSKSVGIFIKYLIINALFRSISSVLVYFSELIYVKDGIICYLPSDLVNLECTYDFKVHHKCTLLRLWCTSSDYSQEIPLIDSSSHRVANTNSADFLNSKLHPLRGGFEVHKFTGRFSWTV